VDVKIQYRRRRLSTSLSGSQIDHDARNLLLNGTRYRAKRSLYHKPTFREIDRPSSSWFLNEERCAHEHDGMAPNAVNSSEKEIKATPSCQERQVKTPSWRMGDKMPKYQAPQANRLILTT